MKAYSVAPAGCQVVLLPELRLVGPELVKVLQQLIPSAEAALKSGDHETRGALVLSLTGAGIGLMITVAGATFQTDKVFVGVLIFAITLSLQ